MSSRDEALLATVSGVVNACCPLPGLLTGGQPTEVQLMAAHAAGLVTVLDSRDPREPRPFDEPAFVAGLGVRYVNVPISGGTLDDTTMERLLAVLRDPAAGPVFFHCGSGNRVGGALLPYFINDHGMSQQDAVALAMRVGLRGAELMQWGLDYAARHRA